jgi:lipopolysaccharide/colanic/teichoic acid biosynthesis glycosyltransferase
MCYSSNVTNVGAQGGRKVMKEIFEQYGAVIITIVAIIALLAILHALLDQSDGGIVYRAFTGVLEDFYKNAQGYLPGK